MSSINMPDQRNEFSSRQSSSTEILLQNPAAEKGDPGRGFFFVAKVPLFIGHENGGGPETAVLVLGFQNPIHQLPDQGIVFEKVEPGEHVGQVEGVVPNKGIFQRPEFF